MSELSFNEKIVAVQGALKATKNQRNTFANFNYRSCEDILEALKPLLKEHGLYQIISDEVLLIGERFYIKATVTVYGKPGELLTASALAREPLAKKGYDEAQITGATSSYARKYALNGMWMIDDNKDADHDDSNCKTKPAVQGKSVHQENAAQRTPAEQEAAAKKLLNSSKNLDDLKTNWNKIYKSKLSSEAKSNLEIIKNDRKAEIEDLAREFTNETGVAANA